MSDDFPARWHFWLDSLRQHKQAAWRGWYTLTGRCYEGHLRKPSHRFGCSRRPGRGGRYYARLDG